MGQFPFEEAGDGMMKAAKTVAALHDLITTPPQKRGSKRGVQGESFPLAGCRGGAPAVPSSSTAAKSSQEKQGVQGALPPARARTQEILRGTAIRVLQYLTCVKVRARRLTRERTFPGDKASSRRRQGKGSRNVTHSKSAHRCAVTSKSNAFRGDVAAA